MQNVNISIEEFRLLTKSLHQLKTLALSDSIYTIERTMERAKETLKEIKQLENNPYKL